MRIVRIPPEHMRLQIAAGKIEEQQAVVVVVEGVVEEREPLLEHMPCLLGEFIIHKDAIGARFVIFLEAERAEEPQFLGDFRQKRRRLGHRDRGGGGINVDRRYVQAKRRRDLLQIETANAAGVLVRQKFRGVRRLMLVLAMPLLTMIAFQSYWREATHSIWENWDDPRSPVLYFVASTQTVAIYFPLVAWLSFAIGLWVRSQTRAIFGSLAIIVAWCVIPMIVAVLVMEALQPYGGRQYDWLLLFSPAMIIPFAEYSFADLQWITQMPWAAVFMNCFVYGTVLAVVRLWCVVSAPRLLGRAERPPVQFPEPVRGAVSRAL